MEQLVIESPAPLLPEILQLHGKWKGDKEAVVCGDVRLSWAELCSRSYQVANGLASLGIQKGDRVVVLMSNGIPMVETLLGIMQAGAVSVPLNLSVDDKGLANMITDSSAAAIVVTEDQQNRLNAELMTGRQCISTGQTTSGFIAYESWKTEQPDTPIDVDLLPDDLLNIIYSSGTTGLPKGIAHSHRGRRDWGYDLAITLRYHPSARILLTIGLYSNISWVGMLSTLIAGGTLVIHKKFDVTSFWETLKQERITHSVMVPIQYQRILEYDKLESVDTSRLVSLMSVGSPLHEGLKKQLFEVFDCGVIELYGLTEGIITALDPEEVEGRWQSVGKPMVGTDIAILDENDQVLPAGESGELVSRGRITMPFYFNRPDATQDALWVDEAGRQWLRSGDIGKVDEQGYLYIVDRKKDMILSGGQNIYPQDIEACMVENPAIDDVAVIAGKSERWGETPVALVVLKKSSSLDANELKDWANQRLGKQQRIAEVIYIDELPRNANGKILKRELRAQIAERIFP